MAVFGWLVFIFGGAILFGKLCAVLGLMLIPGGLEAIPGALASGILGAVMWVVIAWWLSPLTLTFSIIQ